MEEQERAEWMEGMDPHFRAPDARTHRVFNGAAAAEVVLLSYNNSVDYKVDMVEPNNCHGRVDGHGSGQQWLAGLWGLRGAF